MPPQGQTQGLSYKDQDQDLNFVLKDKDKDKDNNTASHGWCQITPFTQSIQSCIMSSGILGPHIQMWPPQTAAARNAPARDPWPGPLAVLLRPMHSTGPPWCT